MKKKITVVTSVDDQFAERLFNKDPFDYFNRILGQAISGDEHVDIPEYKVEKYVKITYKKTNDRIYNYQCEYFIEFVGPGDCIVDNMMLGIVSFFKVKNCIME